LTIYILSYDTTENNIDKICDESYIIYKEKNIECEIINKVYLKNILYSNNEVEEL